MGNKLTCMPQQSKSGGGRRKGKGKNKSKGGLLPAVHGSRRRTGLEEELLQQQALAMALFQHHNQIPGARSVSQRYPSSVSKHAAAAGAGPAGLTRCTSARPRSVSDPFLNADQLFKHKPEANGFDNLETKHFVLIHGGGFGAWCWYKSIALLEEAGFVATALDLTGSGIDHTEANSITTLAHYVKPLLDFLEKLPEDEKIILVGHSFGGACITYAMERFPHKVTKAIFVAAAMVKNGQSAFDVFADELTTTNELIKNSQVFIYANGNEKPPTGLEFDKGQLKELFFNQSPNKDVALATVSMRPIPFAPVLERIPLTEEKHGSVRRFFVQTWDDNVLTLPAQQRLVEENPPEKVFKIKSSDHCPFFSKPQSFHKVLLEIAQLNKT